MHHKRGAAELARALFTLEGRDDVVLTNCASYLASHPAADRSRSVGEFLELSAWGRPMARELRMPLRSQHRAELARAISRRDGIREQSRRGRLTIALRPALVKDPNGLLRDGIRMLIDRIPPSTPTFQALQSSRGRPSRDPAQDARDGPCGAGVADQLCVVFDDFGGSKGASR